MSDHPGVYGIEETKLKRTNTSLRIRISLLRSAGKRIGDVPGPWHVAVRRGILRPGPYTEEADESPYDYGGEDTYVKSLSRQNMTEVEAKEHFAVTINTLIRMGSWDPKHLP